jgi:hypothetical protein
MGYHKMKKPPEAEAYHTLIYSVFLISLLQNQHR